MTNEWVYDLKGKEVAFTRKIDGYIKDDLSKIARKLGARNVRRWVNQSSADGLVRGWSSQWKHGNFDEKEKQTAELQRVGHRTQIIDTEGFFGLRSHYPAPALKPNVPGAAARGNATEGVVSGAPYRAGSSAGKKCNFDLAWHFTDVTVGIAEVKATPSGTKPSRSGTDWDRCWTTAIG